MGGSKPEHPVMRTLHRIEDFAAGAVLFVLVTFAVVQLMLKSMFAEFTLFGKTWTIIPMKWFLDNVGHGFIWGESLLRHLVLWLAILGAMVATRHDRHINVEIASKFLPIRLKTGIRIFTDAFTAVICGLICYAGIELVKSEMGAGDIAFGKVPSWTMEAIIPIGFAVISLRYLRYFVVHILQEFGVMALTEEKPHLPIIEEP